MPKRKEAASARPNSSASSKSGLRNSAPLPPAPAPTSSPPPKRVRATAPKTNRNASSDIGATLPEEILLAIFSHINPFTQDYLHTTTHPWMRKEYWMPLQLLNLALVSKRFYGIMAPLFLAPTFEGWVHRYVTLRYRKRKRGWAPIVKMVSEFPHLGRWLRDVKVEMGEGYAWQTVKEGEEVDSGRMLVKRDVWSEEDFERAEGCVDELCRRDIWNRSPTMPREQRGGEMVSIEEMKTQWKEHAGLGRTDALLALLFARTPNLAKLALKTFQAPREEKSMENWSDFAVGGDDNYLTRLFRGATNSQVSAKQDDGRDGDAFFPCLGSMEIMTEKYASDKTLTIQEVLPYLTLPSLSYATIGLLAPDSRYTSPPDMKLPLKALTIESTRSVSPCSSLLNLCPQVTDFTYSQNWMPFDASASPPKLLPHLVTTGLATQLTHLTLGSRSLPDPHISSIHEFKNLTSLNVSGRNIAVLFRRDDHAALWRTLPPSLEHLKILRISDIVNEDEDEEEEDEYAKVGNALGELPGLREKGCMPRLREVVIQEQRIENERHPEWAEKRYALEKVCDEVSTESLGVQLIEGPRRRLNC